MFFIQYDFGRVLQILQVHCLHLRGERFVFDDCVQFEIPKPASDIEIRGSNAGPASSATAVFACSMGRSTRARERRFEQRSVPRPR